MSHPYFEDARHPRVFAHRGLASPETEDAPAVWENSAGAIAAAHAVGVEYIETDCQVTADGDVVLFHDDTLLRLTGDPRPVGEVSTRELREIFASNGGLLTVEEALESFPQLRFNVDVKTDAVAGRIGPLIAPQSHRVLITSFSDQNRLAALAGAQKAGAAQRPATSPGSATIARLLPATILHAGPVVRRLLTGIDALQIPVSHRGIRVLRPSLLRAAQQQGVEVHIWTVNDSEEMRSLVAEGVDGIVTDHADLAVETLH